MIVNNDLERVRVYFLTQLQIYDINSQHPATITQLTKIIKKFRKTELSRNAERTDDYQEPGLQSSYRQNEIIDPQRSLAFFTILHVPLKE